MQWTPHATVATVVERDGKYLLVKEYSAGQVVYNQPAGHIEANESIEQAAIRETLEETRWIVKPTALVGMYVYLAPNNVTYHRLCFAADAIEHNTQAKLDDGIIDAQWLSWDEICQLDNLRSPLVKKCIEDYRANKRYPLEFIFDQQL